MTKCGGMLFLYHLRLLLGYVTVFQRNIHDEGFLFAVCGADLAVYDDFIVFVQAVGFDNDVCGITAHGQLSGKVCVAVFCGAEQLVVCVHFVYHDFFRTADGMKCNADRAVQTVGFGERRCNSG